MLGTELKMGAKTPGKLLEKWHFEINKDPIEAQPRHIMSTLGSYMAFLEIVSTHVREANEFSNQANIVQ